MDHNEKTNKRKSKRHKKLTQRLVDQLELPTLQVESPNHALKGTKPLPKYQLKNFVSLPTVANQNTLSGCSKNSSSMTDSDDERTDSDSSSHSEVVPNGAGGLRSRRSSKVKKSGSDSDSSSSSSGSFAEDIRMYQKYQTAELVPSSSSSDESGEEATHKKQTALNTPKNSVKSKPKKGAPDLSQNETGEGLIAAPAINSSCPEIDEHRHRELALPQFITHDAQNALVTKPAVLRLSQNARELLRKHLEAIEVKFQSLIHNLHQEGHLTAKLVAPDPAPVKSAPVPQPSQDPKLDLVMAKITELAEK